MALGDVVFVRLAVEGAELEGERLQLKTSSFLEK